MKWLDKNFLEVLAHEIMKHHKAIYEGTHQNYGVVENITVDGKNYLMRYDRNTGVHYIFDIYDRDDIIVSGEFPAVPVDEKYNVIRFYSKNNAVIFEYKLQ